MRNQPTCSSVSDAIAMGFRKTLKLLGMLAIAAMLISGAETAHASPEDGSMEDLRERIVRLCNEAWGNDAPREQQCRTDNVKLLDDYIRLVNSYPPNSAHYRVLIECSQKWPESITMWKMCANLEMPNEPAFRPFDTGISPIEALRQYQAAQPNSLAPADPGRLPENLRNLPNPTLPRDGAAGGGMIGQQQQTQGSQTVAPASSLSAPRQNTRIAPQQPAGSVYVPGAGVRQ